MASSYFSSVVLCSIAQASYSSKVNEGGVRANAYGLGVTESQYLMGADIANNEERRFDEIRKRW